MKFPGKRFCPDCPRLSWEKHQLTEHADHLATHNPSPAAWATAYIRIQEWKDRAKGKD